MNHIDEPSRYRGKILTKGQWSTIGNGEQSESTQPDTETEETVDPNDDAEVNTETSEETEDSSAPDSAETQIEALSEDPAPSDKPKDSFPLKHQNNRSVGHPKNDQLEGIESGSVGSSYQTKSKMPS